MILFTVFYYWVMLKILQILLLLSYIYISIIACHHHKKSFQTFNNYVPVWIQIIVASAFLLCGFLFFLFLFPARICWLFYSEQCICVLFTDPQIPLFSNLFIKNGSHDTIYTFKNYFATVFSISEKISSIQTDPIYIV